MDNMPLFVKIEKYDAVLEAMEQIKVKMQEAETLLHQIEELKNEEDAELERWKVTLDTVTAKVGFIQQSLTQSRQ